MTLIRALEHATPDSQGNKRAFGKKEDTPNQYRAFASPNAGIEIQVRTVKDWMWITVAMILPSEGRWVDPEIVWWPS